MACPQVPTANLVSPSVSSVVGGYLFDVEMAIQNSDLSRELTIELDPTDGAYTMGGDQKRSFEFGECEEKNLTFDDVSIRPDPYSSKTADPNATIEVQVIEPGLGGGVNLGSFEIKLAGSPCEVYSDATLDEMASYDDDGDFNTTDVHAIFLDYEAGNVSEEFLNKSSAVWTWGCDPLSSGASVDPSKVSVDFCGTTQTDDRIESGQDLRFTSQVTNQNMHAVDARVQWELDGTIVAQATERIGMNTGTQIESQLQSYDEIASVGTGSLSMNAKVVNVGEPGTL